MNTFYKWSIIAILAILAIASYSYGSSQGAIIFVALGAIFELMFWFKIFDKNRSFKK
jgi:hypothetical protein